MPVRTFVSSRTDVGVHAYANTFHFDLTRITKKGEPVRILDAICFHAL